MLFSSYVNAGNDRSIAYAQQDTPGAIVVVSIFEHGKKYVASVNGFGTETFEKTILIDKQYFDSLWVLATSEEISKYTFIPTPKDRMATPQFRTMTLEDSKGMKKQFKIPHSESNKSAEELISAIKDLMSK
ncbi:hypothetical protein GCM10011613_20590 [Cellvibrio zantedeschiae]|uniref:Uncharacterized protein n=2 Tax=Cellvibrio zantedeschiae TaxID=1237077 RepID=A0ABQ3B2L0_9GAMM|nr:hypothetical protein GCM10011613_20590 [Cellvibrio zantedeschiae]